MTKEDYSRVPFTLGTRVWEIVSGKGPFIVTIDEGGETIQIHDGDRKKDDCPYIYTTNYDSTEPGIKAKRQTSYLVFWTVLILVTGILATVLKCGL